MPKNASAALFDIVSGELDKKVAELRSLIIDMATGVDPQDRDKIVNDTIQKLMEAYRFYSS